MRLFNFMAFIFVCCFCAACAKDPVVQSDRLIEGFTYVGQPEIEYPADNPPSEAARNLGKRLFYEPLMSKDGSTSCASCHLPERAFSDTSMVSSGFASRLGTRNSSPLFNLAYHPYFTREGGVATLEMQVLVPIQEAHEFNTNILTIAEELGKDSTYQQMSRLAFGRALDYYVITRAIANFERTLISSSSAFDRYFAGDKASINSQELKGMKLFYSDKTRCGTCHSGFNFTNYSFANNGLYADYSDPGRFRLTKDKEDLSMFKVPSLRNVEFTAPYMHDGSLKTLEEVVEHYNSGGESHTNKSIKIQALNLARDEKEALVSFLKSLSDHEFITNKNHKKSK
jgi:cytochrome c peroxidase